MPSTSECHCMCCACLKLSGSLAVLCPAGGITINTCAKWGTRNCIRKLMFQAWCQCSFKVRNDGKRSIIGVLISSTQMTQLQKNPKRFLGLSPSSAALEQAEESKGLKEKASNCFWALPPPQWLHQGILISRPSTSSHVQLVETEAFGPMSPQLGSSHLSSLAFSLKCNPWPGQVCWMFRSTFQKYISLLILEVLTFLSANLPSIHLGKMQLLGL